jgi:hypothetical protein
MTYRRRKIPNARSSARLLISKGLLWNWILHEGANLPGGQAIENERPLRLIDIEFVNSSRKVRHEGLFAHVEDFCYVERYIVDPTLDVGHFIEFSAWR